MKTIPHGKYEELKREYDILDFGRHKGCSLSTDDIPFCYKLWLVCDCEVVKLGHRLMAWYSLPFYTRKWIYEHCCEDVEKAIMELEL